MMTENNIGENSYTGKEKVTKWKRKRIIKTSKTKEKNSINKKPKIITNEK